MITALLFVISTALVVVAAELFTNAVEWAGFRLRLGSGATGSLLAALGTSLPETVVPVVALATHAPSASSVAQGAIFGSSFMLLTIGAGATGVAVLLRGGPRLLVVEARQPRQDLGVFIVAFSAALLATTMPAGPRVAVGVALLMVYVVYVFVTVRGGTPVEERPEPLHIVRWRSGRPHASFIAVQLVMSVALLVLGSELFVNALGQTAGALKVPALVLALIIVPLATELPETLNSVVWVRSRDDMLAFGNVAGSAAFQSCVLGFIGVVFTPWRPGSPGVISGVITLAVAAYLLALLWRGRARGALLALAMIPWLGYVIVALATGGRLGG